jgi:hypothetical protein
MFFVSRPVTLTGIEILDWITALELLEAEAATEPAQGKP